MLIVMSVKPTLTDELLKVNSALKLIFSVTEDQCSGRLSNRRGWVGKSWVVGRGSEISHVNTSLYIYFYAARNSGFLCNLFLA